MKLPFRVTSSYILFSLVLVFLVRETANAGGRVWVGSVEGCVGGGGDREMKQDGIKAKDEAQFIKGQNIITCRNACSTGGH